MNVDTDVRRAMLGGNPVVRNSWVLVALSLFVVTGLYTLVSHFVYGTEPEVVLWLFVLVGVALSVVSAYWNSGLVVSWLLVFGPVCGPLTFYWWVRLSEGAGSVGIFLSFTGSRAPGFWIPVAFALGTLAFGVGVLGRWGTNYLTAR